MARRNRDLSGDEDDTDGNGNSKSGGQGEGANTDKGKGLVRPDQRGEDTTILLRTMTLEPSS